MNKDSLRKLAKNIVELGSIDKRTAMFILSRLSRRELIDFVRLLKSFLARKTIVVTSATILSEPIRRELVNQFPAKNVAFRQDKSLGDGIKLVVNDTVIDLSFKNYLNEAVNTLKSAL